MDVNTDGYRGGDTFDAQRDMSRLNQQHRDVYNAVCDGGWYSLADIKILTGHPEASISARLRDFRKKQFGGMTVNRRYIENGLWEYQLCVQ